MPYEWKPADFKAVVKQVTSASGEPMTEMVSAITRKGFLSCPPPPWDPEGIYRVAVERGKPQVQRLGGDDAWVPTRLSGPQADTRERHQKFGILDAPNLLAADLAVAVGPLGAALLYLDADHFKLLNTRYTERLVDRDLLPDIHRLVEAATHDHGYAYAEGGDEMIVLLRNHSELMGLAFAETLRAAVEARTFQVNGAAVRLTVSIGVAAAPHNDRASLPERANLAKAEAKRCGRNAVYLARPEGTRRVKIRLDEGASAPAAWRGAFR
jgi:diguanylate cyclase (GGDEF)-like protein